MRYDWRWTWHLLTWRWFHPIKAHHSRKYARESERVLRSIFSEVVDALDGADRPRAKTLDDVFNRWLARHPEGDEGQS